MAGPNGGWCARSFRVASTKAERAGVVVRHALSSTNGYRSKPISPFCTIRSLGLMELTDQYAIGRAPAWRPLSAPQRARRERILGAAVDLLNERSTSRFRCAMLPKRRALQWLLSIVTSRPRSSVCAGHRPVGATFDVAVRAESRVAGSDAARLLSVLRRTVRSYEHSPTSTV